jgi:O-methyltransferase
MTANLQRWQQLHRKYKNHTMLWEPMFWENLDLCLEYHQPGYSVVECGVWKGGMMGAMAEAINDPTARFHLFDSFEGLPEAQPVDGKAALDWQKDTQSPIYYNNCKADIEDAREAMALSGVTDYRIHPGWFENTLPGFRSETPISILRLDADWYASTMQCLEVLYPQVTAGGVIIVDDYFTWEGCAKAVHDYFANEGVTENVRQTAHKVAYIVKQ